MEERGLGKAPITTDELLELKKVSYKQTNALGIITYLMRSYFVL